MNLYDELSKAIREFAKIVPQITTDEEFEDVHDDFIQKLIEIYVCVMM